MVIVVIYYVYNHHWTGMDFLINRGYKHFVLIIKFYGGW